MSTAIDIRNVVKQYGTTTVPHGFSLSIGDNPFVSLRGPSGCGEAQLPSFSSIR